MQPMWAASGDISIGCTCSVGIGRLTTYSHSCGPVCLSLVYHLRMLSRTICRILVLIFALLDKDTLAGKVSTTGVRSMIAGRFA